MEKKKKIRAHNRQKRKKKKKRKTGLELQAGRRRGEENDKNEFIKETVQESRLLKKYLSVYANEF